MKRPIYVDQRENTAGDNFWYVARGGNAENVLTSKMYTQRWRAVRAARAFIRSIDPAPVRFSYWTGPTKPGGRGLLKRVTETLGGR